MKGRLGIQKHQYFIRPSFSWGRIEVKLAWRYTQWLKYIYEDGGNFRARKQDVYYAGMLFAQTDGRRSGCVPAYFNHWIHYSSASTQLHKRGGVLLDSPVFLATVRYSHTAQTSLQSDLKADIFKYFRFRWSPSWISDFRLRFGNRNRGLESPRPTWGLL